MALQTNDIHNLIAIDRRTGKIESPGKNEDQISYAVQFANGVRHFFGGDDPQFIVRVSDEREWDSFFQTDAYSAALAFVKGKISITGDIPAAIRFYSSQNRPSFFRLLFTVAELYGPSRLETWIQSREKAAKNIRFHYDRSNEFYSHFLDPRMVYSCAYFEDDLNSLEAAQLAKLEHICRKLCLSEKDSFLDIGCGWGALVIHAAGKYGAVATGCTLSSEQLRFAKNRVIESGLADRVSLFERDYRGLEGRFSKVSSVGMFEHVGKRRLGEYFRKLYDLLDDHGLLLNHGITRPEPVCDGPESLFIRRNVFPGGELPHLSDVIREAENAGFEVLDVENLRRHYAQTCKAWVQNLQTNDIQCYRCVGLETYRTWILFLATSAVKFQDGLLGLHQVLLSKRGHRVTQPSTRDYMYSHNTRF